MKKKIKLRWFPEFKPKKIYPDMEIIRQSRFSNQPSSSSEFWADRSKPFFEDNSWDIKITLTGEKDRHDWYLGKAEFVSHKAPQDLLVTGASFQLYEGSLSIAEAIAT